MLLLYFGVGRFMPSEIQIQLAKLQEKKIIPMQKADTVLEWNQFEMTSTPTEITMILSMFKPGGSPLVYARTLFLVAIFIFETLNKELAVGIILTQNPGSSAISVAASIEISKIREM